MSTLEDPQEELGRRCEIGCESWPDSDDFKVCPICREPTKRWSNLTPLDEAEARSMRLHLEFEHRYGA